MKYAKPPLTFEQQADLILSRGMVGDRALLIERLQTVNYYRLSAYWHPFKNPDDTFKPGTAFESIWRRYVFDRRLRLLVMDAIERIEVFVRSQLAYHHTHRYSDPFAYATDPAAFPCLSAEDRNRLLYQLEEDGKKCRETFAAHFKKKYGADHPFMPIWMMAEVMTFGSMLTLFRGCEPDIRKTVASALGIHDVVLTSWLLTINTIRNVCAHHERLWNRELGVKPKIPDKDERWRKPVVVGNERVFGILTICKHSLSRIAPQSGWAARLRRLLEEFRDVPRTIMGFPPNWPDSPIWREPG